MVMAAEEEVINLPKNSSLMAFSHKFRKSIIFLIINVQFFKRKLAAYLIFPDVP